MRSSMEEPLVENMEPRRELWGTTAFKGASKGDREGETSQLWEKKIVQYGAYGGNESQEKKGIQEEGSG